MPYFFSFFDIGRQAALTCYKLFQMWVRYKKDSLPLFWIFFFFLSFLHWAEHEAVTMQPLQISAPGTVPMHFSVSLLLSRLLLLHPPPFPSPICLLQACVYLTEGRADSLVYSNAASSSVFITVTSLNPTFPATF